MLYLHSIILLYFIFKVLSKGQTHIKNVMRSRDVANDDIKSANTYWNRYTSQMRAENCAP
jgi:hypothetical protein